MSGIKQLYEITLELNEVLESFPSKNEREAYIAKLNRILEEREEIIRLLPKEYTDEEKKLGIEINRVNRDIDTKLNNLFNEIKKDMQNIKKAQLVNKKYNQGFSGDGMFFDKRK